MAGHLIFPLPFRKLLFLRIFFRRPPGSAKFLQLFDNVAHEIDIVGTPSPIMADGTGHSLIQIFIDD